MSLNPTTLQDIITQIRLRIDMPTSQYITDIELTQEIDNSLAQLDGILISKFQRYKITPAIVGVLPGTNLIQLPADFIKFNGLDVFFSPTVPDGYYTMYECPFEHRNKKIWPTSAAIPFGPYALQYTIEGLNIAVVPFQIAANYQYRLWYVPDYVPLGLTNGVPNYGAQLQPYMDTQSWYEYAVLDCCIKVLLKQDMEAGQFMQQKAELKDMIIRLFTPNRNLSEPVSIIDGGRGGNNNGGGYGWDW